MARWPDLAVWLGPTPNRTDGGMNRYDGQVTHIAAGYFEGTIDWQRNDASNVSSHFVVGREWGQCAQMVDLDDAAWTQGDGNGEWISVENAGFLKGHKLWQPGWEQLSPWQIECNARLFARGHQVYGWPLQLTNHPTRKGLGYHAMGAENGYRWGHIACPGEPIKAQLPLILARAKEIVTGDDMFGDSEKEQLTRVETTLGSLVQGLTDTTPQYYHLGKESKQFPIVPNRQLRQITADMAELKAKLAELKVPAPAPVDVAELVAALTPAMDAAAERAVRRVMLDAATPDTGEARTQ